MDAKIIFGVLEPRRSVSDGGCECRFERSILRSVRAKEDATPQLPTLKDAPRICPEHFGSVTPGPCTFNSHHPRCATPSPRLKCFGHSLGFGGVGFGIWPLGTSVSSVSQTWHLSALYQPLTPGKPDTSHFFKLVQVSLR